MLKHICKAINMTTRVIVGNTNPSITDRTHKLDIIMTTRHEVKKDGHLDAAADAELLGMLDLAMGREGDTATELTLERLNPLSTGKSVQTREYAGAFE